MTVEKWPNGDTRTKAEAQAVLDELRVAIRQGTFGAEGSAPRQVGPMPFHECAEDYRERHALARAIDWWLRPLLARFGDLTLAGVKTVDVQDFMGHLRNPRGVGKRNEERCLVSVVGRDGHGRADLESHGVHEEPRPVDQSRDGRPQLLSTGGRPAEPLMSDEHFTVEGTLIEAWASQKSFQRKDGASRRRRRTQFRGHGRKNDMHASKTDPDARLYRNAQGAEFRLAYLNHLLIENRHGLIAGAMATQADGLAEREQRRVQALPSAANSAILTGNLHRSSSSACAFPRLSVHEGRAFGIDTRVPVKPDPGSPLARGATIRKDFHVVVGGIADR